MAHPIVHSMCDLLEHVKGLILQTQSYRISTTQDNSRIAKRSSNEGPEARVWQKPEVLN